LCYTKYFFYKLLEKNYLLQINRIAYLNHLEWMERALELARQAGEEGDVPVGAIITDLDGNLLAEASNRKERDRDPTAHAEIIAIRKTSQILQNWHLNNCILYVTLEPCPMCAGAIIQARIGLLVYGVDDPKTGTIRTVANLPDSFCSNHKLTVLAGINETKCREQLQSWFEKKRSSVAST
jgi:tRNA(adenine34) deaminase